MYHYTSIFGYRPEDRQGRPVRKQRGLHYLDLPTGGVNAKITLMRKPLAVTLILLAAGTFRASVSAAQDTPAAKPPATAAPKSPSATAAKGQTATAPRTPRAPGARSGTALTLKTPKEKTSYAIGLNIGKSLKKDSLDVDPNILARGLRDALAGGKTLLTDDEAKAAILALQGDLRKRMDAKMQADGSVNKKAGEEFLSANKTKDGVVTLPSGLQYKVLKEGTGPKPTASDTVVCNYRGTLLNNTEFDSSYKRGQPATFPVGQVIKGWTEALQLMPVGSKWQLFVPASLAYGAQGAGADIGPESTLIFEVELISIQGK